MIEPVIIVTNNIMVMEKTDDKYQKVFVEGCLMDVLKKVRDYVHMGHRLLTHPLSGSIKPNETPYKTVLISRANGETTDVDSLILIENSIMTAEKFISRRSTPNWTEKLLGDFRLIDYDLIKHVLN
jgi:hypothetical protein